MSVCAETSLASDTSRCSRVPCSVNTCLMSTLGKQYTQTAAFRGWVSVECHYQESLKHSYLERRYQGLCHLCMSLEWQINLLHPLN